MAALDQLMQALDKAVWEMSEALNGLPDEDTWRRPDPRLLSVGEIAAHVAYWESQSFLGEGTESPLVTAAARYYPSHVKEPFQLSLGADAVLEEILRIHDLCKASFEANPHDSEESNPNRDGWTWGSTVEYQVIHVAYHTGQMYSVRHLLGHETVDN
jgi:uncharacterized damage-inducible protein DinB